MGKSLTNYKKLYLCISLEDKVSQTRYANIMSEIAATYNLSFSVIHQNDKKLDGLVIYLFDSLASLNQVKQFHNNHILFHHINEENYIPTSDSYYTDAIFSIVPSKKTLAQILIRSLKLKDRKTKLLMTISSFFTALNSNNLELAKELIPDIIKMSGKLSGIGEYLAYKLYFKNNNFELAFKKLSFAYSLVPKNPLYMYDLQGFLYHINHKEDCLILCSKFIQKFPRCPTIISRGMELSIMTRNFENLDIFFRAAKGLRVNDFDYRSKFNAALSVYIRFLARNKKYDEIKVYMTLLNDSTDMKIYWSNMLAELMKTIPAENWKDLYKGTCELMIKESFPEESKIIEEMVHYGMKSAKASCQLLIKNGTSLNPLLSKLVENVLMAQGD